jgi:hypothetical protein
MSCSLIRGHNTERAVLSADEVNRRLDDAFQHDADLEMFDDRLVGTQQGSKAPLNPEDVVRTGNEVIEGMIQLAALRVGERQTA